MNAVEFDAVLKVDSFNFGYALEVNPRFIELEYPFYWADVYELTHEFYDLWLHGVAFSKMKIVMLPLPEGTNAVDDLRDEAISLFSEKPIRVPHGGRLCAPDISSSSFNPGLKTRRFASRSNHPESTRSSPKRVSKSFRPLSAAHRVLSSFSRFWCSSRSLLTGWLEHGSARQTESAAGQRAADNRRRQKKRKMPGLRCIDRCAIR
jgi:hypothetical protein